jgi:hypothetical protein
MAQRKRAAGRPSGRPCSAPLGKEPEHVFREGLRNQHVRDVLLTVDDGDAGVRQSAGRGVDVAPEVRRTVAAGD